jgi:hypothetical protein
LLGRFSGRRAGEFARGGPELFRTGAQDFQRFSTVQIQVCFEGICTAPPQFPQSENQPFHLDFVGGGGFVSLSPKDVPCRTAAKTAGDPHPQRRTT